MWFFWPDFWVKFWKMSFGRWILEGECFRRPLLLEIKTGWKKLTQEFGSSIRASKLRFAEFGPKFGFRRCKFPVQKFVPEFTPILFCRMLVSELVGIDRVVSNTGGFGGCSLAPTTRMRVHSDVPWYKKLRRRVHSDVSRYQEPEWGHIRQNRPFTKPPFCFLSILPFLGRFSSISQQKWQNTLHLSWVLFFLCFSFLLNLHVSLHSNWAKSCSFDTRTHSAKNTNMILATGRYRGRDVFLSLA